MPLASEQPLALLAKVPIFAGLDKNHLGLISDMGKRLSYDSGRKIVRQGEKGGGFYLILGGQVQVRSGEKILAKLGKGDFFGEIALFDAQPRSADIVAITPTTCFGLTQGSLERLLQKEPKIAVGIIRELAHRLRKADAALTE